MHRNGDRFMIGPDFPAHSSQTRGAADGSAPQHAAFAR
ncbi:hypothetical protein NX02_24150 [Sphingomonas sanxanigenens DSM 19645 = NX02]|uniref:Uncharacterized protein n=1 Tax=Sphingomonas sanxanigenens DSM 19645 = NX02 TaxID=1123269 RepID=W0AJG7_9SPHN|nr:hypothetical protein NX02_24150 [Sphingomonas sanxanigenens DSM 19645 = NX02]